MGYSGIGFGPADLRLPAEELVAAVAPVGNEPTPFLSANVGLLGLDANITPRFRVVEIGGLRVGITSVLADSKSADLRNACHRSHRRRGSPPRRCRIDAARPL